VIVREGRIVGEGFHQGVGTPHAETNALAQAWRASARGDDLRHAGTVRARGHGRRSAAHALRASLFGGRHRPRRVRDDRSGPARGGRGFEQLRAAGVEVTVGVCENAARHLIRAYVKHRTTGLPYVTHKAAMTLDGKIAAPSATASG
jgi:diaminohydroxyphosphoribosylaminopyrimidine deaminase/5-amino-6-(5-phosphoribosylamino)uracil reductase